MSRNCLDYRKFNTVTRRDLYPLVQMDGSLDALKGSRHLTGLNLAAGYWQAVMDEAFEDKIASITYSGQYQFERMPLELANAPSTFFRMMNTVPGDLKFQSVMVYLDEVQIQSPDFTIT